MIPPWSPTAAWSTTWAVNGPMPWSELKAKKPSSPMAIMMPISTVAWPWIGLGRARPAGL